MNVNESELSLYNSKVYYPDSTLKSVKPVEAKKEEENVINSRTSRAKS